MNQTLLTREHAPHETKSSIFRNKNFVIAWLSSLFTGLAFSMYLLGETWYVVNELKLETMLGFVLMMTAIPRVVLTMVGGVLADRLDKRKVMFYADLSRVGVLIVMVWLLLTGVLPITVLLLFAFIFGTLDGLYQPASSSLVVQLVERSQLTKANAFMQTSMQICMLVGPLLAATLLFVGSYTMLFSVVAACLFVGACMILLVKRRDSSEKREKKSFKAEWLEGYRYVRADTFILSCMALICLINLLIAGPAMTSIPLIVEQKLAGSALELSYFEAAMAVGMIVGATCIGLSKQKKRRATWVLLLLLLLCLTQILWAGISTFLYGIVILWVTGTILGMTNVLVITIMQERIDSDKIGRVMSFVGTAAQGLLPVSFGIMGVLLSVGVSVSMLLIITGILGVFLTISMFYVKAYRAGDQV
ncbi:MFS transporter [Hazenella sp. IB182357]|uniref:MFS transporter n=1 Tax=Polycladospora coralii TaxID=2771432 RepID=A0A926N8Y5_9BACL|nr:MFS transporter [Polycladospora coralii]MBD1372321.1 MFS transporter [Polycladospora coralii]MBS7531489.1 MFS transporter [Polycladospora coralii]